MLMMDVITERKTLTGIVYGIVEWLKKSIRKMQNKLQIIMRSMEKIRKMKKKWINAIIEQGDHVLKKKIVRIVVPVSWQMER